MGKIMQQAREALLKGVRYYNRLTKGDKEIEQQLIDYTAARLRGSFEMYGIFMGAKISPIYDGDKIDHLIMTDAKTDELLEHIVV